MTSIEQALVESVLADLAYVATLTEGMSERERTDKFALRVTQPLAERFAARFEILATKSDPGTRHQVEQFRYAGGGIVTQSQAAGLVSEMAAFTGGEPGKGFESIGTCTWPRTCEPAPHQML